LKLEIPSQAAKTGNGKILANFREISAPARAIVNQKIAMLKEAGIGGVYALGNTSQPICQIEVENIAKSGLIDFQQLRSF